MSQYSCNWGFRRGEGWLVVVVFLGRWIEFQEFAKPSRGITLAGKLLFWASRYFVENSRYKIGAKLIQGWILSKNNAHWWCFSLFIYCLSNLLIYISLPNALNIFPFSHLSHLMLRWFVCIQKKGTDWGILTVLSFIICFALFFVRVLPPVILMLFLLPLLKSFLMSFDKMAPDTFELISFSSSALLWCLLCFPVVLMLFLLPLLQIIPLRYCCAGREGGRKTSG